MKLKIYDETKKYEEGTIRVRLVDECDGVTLAVVDENGDIETNGYLLLLTNFGKVVLFDSVDDSFGFNLDEDGVIKHGRTG